MSVIATAYGVYTGIYCIPIYTSKTPFFGVNCIFISFNFLHLQNSGFLFFVSDFEKYVNTTFFFKIRSHSGN